MQQKNNIIDVKQKGTSHKEQQKRNLTGIYKYKYVNVTIKHILKIATKYYKFCSES